MPKTRTDLVSDDLDERRSLRARDTCSCGLHIPPRGVTPSAAWVAEHDWYHRLMAHTARAVRDEPATRTELEELVDAAVDWITELRRQRSELKSRVLDLRERVEELEYIPMAEL
jgi:hypothetical protein